MYVTLRSHCLSFCLLADAAHYHAWSTQLGRVHDSFDQYAARLNAFINNKAKIHTHNAAVAKAAAPGSSSAQSVSHKLALNHFADWPREAFDRVMLPRKWKRDHGVPVTQVCLISCVPTLGSSCTFVVL